MMVVVKVTMIVAETHTRLFSFTLVVTLVFFHLPLWLFSLVFIHPRGHLLFLQTALVISMVLVNMGLVMIWLVVLFVFFYFPSFSLLPLF